MRGTHQSRLFTPTSILIPRILRLVQTHHASPCSPTPSNSITLSLGASARLVSQTLFAKNHHTLPYSCCTIICGRYSTYLFSCSHETKNVDFLLIYQCHTSNPLYLFVTAPSSLSTLFDLLRANQAWTREDPLSWRWSLIFSEACCVLGCHGTTFMQ